MILPASLIRIRVVQGGKKQANLWIPLILVWPLVIVMMVVLAPVALLACIVRPKIAKFILAGPRVLGTCWAIRGLEVRVNDEDSQVLVSFR